VGRAESLNVGVSASVLCFEVLRQWRLPDGGDQSAAEPMQRGSTISGMDASLVASDERRGPQPAAAPAEVPDSDDG
jgi:hypothetical protein